MERLLIELVEDIRFEHGTWHPVDDRAQLLIDALARSCTVPQRAFSRSPASLDRERVALGRAGDLPDLNKFYVVTGDPAVLSALEIVAWVTRVEPASAAVAPEGLPEGARVVLPSHTRLLADEIDHVAAGLGDDDLVVIPCPVGDRAAWAAAEVAARRGVHVIAQAGGEVPTWVTRVVVAAPQELVTAAVRAWGVGGTGKGRRLRVTLESIRLVAGGDRGDSEIYLEGWIEDARERTSFRVPPSGAVTHVERGGNPINLHTGLHEGGRRDDGDLIVHVEVWERDLGRESLLDPDDLIGTVHVRFGENERWGEGLHTRHTQDGEGDCEVTFAIELLHGTA